MFFLGINYDSRNLTLSLPSDKEQKVCTVIEKFSNLKSCSIREWSSFFGLLNSICVLVPYSRLYTKEFEKEKYLNLLKSDNNFEVTMDLPRSLSPTFTWWKSNIVNAVNPIRRNSFALEIFVDPSTSG